MTGLFLTRQIEVDEVDSFIDVMRWINQETSDFENYGLFEIFLSFVSVACL